VVVDGRRGLLEDLTGWGWRIITKKPIDRGLLSDSQRALLDLLDIRILTVSPVPGTSEVLDIEMDYDHWLMLMGAEAVIVRPDFYTYGSLSSLSGLGSALDTLRGQLELVK
jgi:hypothetical protein